MGDKENVLVVSMEPSRRLRDVLRKVGQMRGEILREQLYSFLEYNPLRRRDPVLPV